MYLLTACVKPIVVKVFDFEKPIKKSFNNNSADQFYIDRIIDVDKINELWDESTPGSYPTSSIFTAYDSILFVQDLSGRLRALNINNGKKIGELKNNGSIEQTPIIAGTFLHYFVNNEKENFSSFVTYDIVNGKELRSIKLKGKFTNELVEMNNHIFAISDFGVLYKFTQWGTIAWEKDLEQYCYSNPISDSSFIYIATIDGSILKVENINGNIVDSKNFASGFQSGFAQDNNSIFIGDINGNFYSINKIGLTIKWKIKTDFKIVISPSSDSSNVYFGNLYGYFYSVNKSKGIVNWKIKTDGIVNISPTVFKNIIILPDYYKYVYFLDVNTGKELRRIDFETRCRTIPFYFRSKLIFGVDKGNIFTYSVN